mmetsp:Transcript_3253/g.4868  ORF Transcript_3253/g.4868 Transcript_3253/m.4868 type:complete len:164 (+) Transcript_3253:31-522(+)
MSGPTLSLQGLHTWAVVGDILNPTKPASSVASSIESQGKILYRVSPTLDVKDASPKKRLYKKFADIPHPPEGLTIDAVNLCCNYRIGIVVLEEMKKRGIKYCFFQPGADHADAVSKAEELGIVYQCGCMIVESLVVPNEEERVVLEEKRKGIVEESGCACAVM